MKRAAVPMGLQALTATAIFLSMLPDKVSADTCAFAAPPTVILNDGKRFLQYWEADDSALWQSGLLPDSTGYWRFVQYTRARLDVSEPHRYLSLSKPQTAADKHNTRLMLGGGIGDLRSINCLEALLLGVQADRHPMETQPTEFLALILRRGEANTDGRLKVWYYTVDQPGIGRLGPLSDAVESDVAVGWKPFLNLHNHNFLFDKTPVVPGVPWPSAIDAQLMKTLSFKKLPFETTAVTNGFSTSHLSPDELKRFQSADKK